MEKGPLKMNENNKKQPFVPLNKQSKQKQKKYHTQKRGTWGELNPVTRKPPNPKAYIREKANYKTEEIEEEQ